MVPFIGPILINAPLKPELSNREEAVKSKWDWIFWFNPQEQLNVFPSEITSQVGASVGDGDH